MKRLQFQMPIDALEIGVGISRTDQRDLGTIGEKRAANALVPDLVRQIGLLNDAIAAFLEETDSVGQREDRFDLELPGRLRSFVDKSYLQSVILILFDL
jgi:hypothetical protein